MKMVGKCLIWVTNVSWECKAWKYAALLCPNLPLANNSVQKDIRNFLSRKKKSHLKDLSGGPVAKTL